MRAAATKSDRWESAAAAPFGRIWGQLALLRAAALAAVRHDALTVAQAIAYSAIVALFPVLIVAAAVIALLPGFLPFRSQLAVFFVGLVPQSIMALLEGYFDNTHQTHSAGALLGALAVSVAGSTNVMATFMEGFRRAHDLPLMPGSFWRRRRRALLLVPLSLVPLSVASALVVFGNVATRWLARTVPGALAGPITAAALLLRWAVALAGSTAILALVYHLGTDLRLGVRSQLSPWLPTRARKEALSGSAARGFGRRFDGSWRGSLPGAVLSTALWFVTTLCFGFYVTRFADYGRIYGSLGAGIALLVWLYLIALCILIGAEFNAQPRQGLPAAERLGAP